MEKITFDIESDLDAIASICGDVCKFDFENNTSQEQTFYMADAGFAPIEAKDIDCNSLYKHINILDRPAHPVRTTYTFNTLYLN